MIESSQYRIAFTFRYIVDISELLYRYYSTLWEVNITKRSFEPITSLNGTIGVTKM